MLENRRIRRSDLPGTVGSSLVLNTGSAVRKLQLTQAVKTYRIKEAQRTRQEGRGAAPSATARVPSPRRDGPPPRAPASSTTTRSASSNTERLVAPPATAAPSPALAPAAVLPSLPLPVPEKSEDPLASSCANEQHHWVYATALRDVLSSDRTSVLLAAGARGVFVYPMVPDAHDDTVRMRLKTVDPGTAHLSYDWAIVYDGNTAESCAGHFSLFP